MNDKGYYQKLVFYIQFCIMVRVKIKGMLVVYGTHCLHAVYTNYNTFTIVGKLNSI